MAFLGVYGHVNVDYLLSVKQLPGADQTVPVEKEEVRLGGTAGNLARAASALGVPVSLAAFIGNDFPASFRQQLASGSIDLTDLRHLDGPTPKVWILTSPEGKQAAVIDQGVMGDHVQRPPLDYTALNSDWVHFTTGPPQEHYAAAKEAGRLRKRVTFDPAQELAFRYDERIFERFLNEADLFVCNEAELGRAMEKLGYADPVQLLDHADAVLVTRGAKGATLFQAKRRHEIPACPPRAPPRDTTGAGDVFRAGLYAGLHARKPLEEAARWGAAAASLYLESGASRFPDLATLKARLGDWKPA